MCAEAVGALKQFECTMFSGEFETVLVESKAAPIVIDADAGIILPPKHVTELDRLSHTVCQIETQCSSVPKGALKFTPLQQIQCNEAFCGLDAQEAFELESW